MKVYVAGKWSDSKNVAKIISELEMMGVEITFNWPEYKELMSNDEQSVGEYENISVERISMAKKCVASLGRDAVLDIQGVLNSDIVIAIMNDPNYAYRGTFTEIGAALGSKKQVYIINKNDDSNSMTNCFYWHPDINHFKNFDSLRETLNSLQLWYH